MAVAAARQVWRLAVAITVWLWSGSESVMVAMAVGESTPELAFEPSPAGLPGSLSERDDTPPAKRRRGIGTTHLPLARCEARLFLRRIQRQGLV